MIATTVEVGAQPSGVVGSDWGKGWAQKQVCVHSWAMSVMTAAPSHSRITLIEEAGGELTTPVTLEISLWGWRDGSAGKGLAILTGGPEGRSSAPVELLGGCGGLPCAGRQRQGTPRVSWLG